jgi:hypothetical protein
MTPLALVDSMHDDGERAAQWQRGCRRARKTEDEGGRDGTEEDPRRRAAGETAEPCPRAGEEGGGATAALG